MVQPFSITNILVSLRNYQPSKLLKSENKYWNCIELCLVFGNTTGKNFCMKKVGQLSTKLGEKKRIV